MTRTDKVKQAIASVGGQLRNQGNPKQIKFGVPVDTTADVLRDSFATPLPTGARLIKTGRCQFEVRVSD